MAHYFKKLSDLDLVCHRCHHCGYLNILGFPNQLEIVHINGDFAEINNECSQCKEFYCMQFEVYSDSACQGDNCVGIGCKGCYNEVISQRGLEYENSM